MAIHSARTLALSDFLAAMEERLERLAPGQLRAVLLAHAQRLPARDREAFLGIFPGGPDSAASPARAPDQDGADPHLLADISAFCEQVRSGVYFQGWGWDDNLQDERSWGDESWVEEMDDLFARAAEVFLAGNMAGALDAYGRLLDALGLDEEVGTFSGPSAAADMVGTDIGEAVARYLRALYETTPPGERAAAVYQRYADLHYLAPSLSLHAIAGTRREQPADLSLFRSAWIDVLAANTDGIWAASRQRLLTEAAVWQGGIDGLAEVARRPGTHQPTTYLDWIDALAGADRLADAGAAAREGLALVDLPGERAAEMADRLATVTLRQGDTVTSLQARRRAWRAAPSRQRLLAMVTAARAAGALSATLIAEAEHHATAPDRLAAELLLLADRADQAGELLAKAPALGWSRPGHPGAVVLPYLMVAATGRPVPPCTTILGRHFAAIDAIGTRDATPSAGGSPGGEEPSGQNTDDQTGRPATPQVPLSTLLAQRLSTQAVPPQRQQWLALAQATVEQRVDAVVTRKHRGAYARVAELAAACAETLTLCRGTTAGEAFLTLIRNRYPRHVAFRRELDTAIRTSSLLPPPPGRHH
jgi:hypothetical protein